jgi:hypothetical protein
MLLQRSRRDVGQAEHGHDVDHDSPARREAPAQAQHQQHRQHQFAGGAHHRGQFGGSSGTWYSSANSASVVSQSRSLVSPDRKKACAT